MTALLDAGYFYEIAGLVYYVFFLFMLRKGNVERYSQRSRILTIIAAIALVGTVPFHYAMNSAAIAVTAVLGMSAIVSAYADVRR